MKQALLEIRPFALSYIKGLPKNKEYKNLICATKTVDEFLKIIDDYKAELKIINE